MLWWSWWLWWLWSRWCPQYVDTWEQWWWLPTRSHSAPPSPCSGWTGTPEVCRRWRWWCWRYFIDGQDFVQYFASVMNRDICHGRNHQMTSSQKKKFHLLTIWRSAKAVFCDRLHLLKFSLQQDLWTKIITNIVFQSFRLCSRTALQVLSTEYTLWLLWPKNWKGEDFVSASVDSCTPALLMLTSTTTQATYTEHGVLICKQIFQLRYRLYTAGFTIQSSILFVETAADIGVPTDSVKITADPSNDAV